MQTCVCRRLHLSSAFPSVSLFQLLAGKLLELPRETFTQETYIQLYQAKMSLSQQVCWLCWLFVRLGADGCEC